MILQKMSNFLPVEMHTTAAIVARHATVSAKAKLKTNLFDGTSSKVIRFLKTTTTTPMFSMRPIAPRILWDSWIVSISEVLNGECHACPWYCLHTACRNCLQDRPFCLICLKRCTETTTTYHFSAKWSSASTWLNIGLELNYAGIKILNNI